MDNVLWERNADSFFIKPVFNFLRNIMIKSPIVVSTRPYRDLELQAPVRQFGNDRHRRRFCQNTIILEKNFFDDLAGMIYIFPTPNDKNQFYEPDPFS